MPKLRLELEALVVESFETDQNGGRFGTVRAHRADAFAAVLTRQDVKSWNPSDCGGDCSAESCDGSCFAPSCATCDGSCAGTCEKTCLGSCAATCDSCDLRCTGNTTCLGQICECIPDTAVLG